MLKIPTQNWLQTNNSDKSGNIAYSKNINLDKEGYVSLSPRSILLFDDATDTSNTADTDFNFPVAFGRYDVGQFRIATTDEPFNLSISNTTKTIAEDAGANNPNLTFDSHGVWWQNRFYESTSTAVNYNANGTWTANAITGLTSGKRHPMAVFKNKQSLAIGDGNTVKLYDTSHSLTLTLTIPSDYEVIGLDYNNYQLGVITRLGDDTQGQNSECFFFVWRGATTESEAGVGVGSYTSACVKAYKSSFVLVDSLGRLLYWNGGGFQELAHFPFYLEEKRWGDTLNFLSYGDNMVVDGDLIYIHLGFDFDGSGKKQEVPLQNNPSGIWCYDPKCGLYHRASGSLSKSYIHNVTSGNVDTSTDLFTTTGTIPNTGNPVIMSSGAVGGLSLGSVYYVIKVSSTTFRLSTTKENALANIYIDITSAGDVYFWMYDIVDYSATNLNKSGAISMYDTSKYSYRDFIFGARCYDTTLNTIIGLYSSVPFLENRGYLVLSTYYPKSVQDVIQKIFIKHKPLDINDKIILKIKTRNIIGLPTMSPNGASNDELVWTSDNEGYTSTDLSEAKTFFDNGGELEIEFIAGAGAGQMTKITEINYESGVYALVFEDEVVGASVGKKSYFIVDNWEKLGEVNSDNQDFSGVYEFLVGKSVKKIDVKFELRGYQTTIEEVQIINQSHEQSK